MKKILLLVFCISLTIGVNAQIRYGAKVGGTFSNATVKYDGKKNDDAYKLGVGFNLGGVLEYSFSESLALQPELLYVLNSIKPKEDGPTEKLGFQSIQVPINVKYKIGIEKLKFHVTAGPYFGYVLSAKLKGKENGISYSYDLFDEDFGWEAKHFDFGLGVGLGIEVSKFTVGVGYQHGIANLTSADKASFKLRSFNISVGYFF